MTTAIGIIPGNVLNFSLRVYFLDGGPNWGFFLAQRIILITTKATKSYTQFNFRYNDTLLFGRESAGVPNKVHKTVTEKLKIPMAKNKRSLNLATSVGIVLAEQIRQIK